MSEPIPPLLTPGEEPDFVLGPWRPVKRIRGSRYLIGSHDSEFAVILHLDAKPRWAPFWITVRRSL